MPGESLWGAFTYSDSYGNANCNCNGYWLTHSNRNADTTGYANTTVSADTEISPDASASAVSVGAMRSFLRELAKQFASSRKAVSSLYHRAPGQAQRWNALSLGQCRSPARRRLNALSQAAASLIESDGAKHSSAAGFSNGLCFGNLLTLFHYLTYHLCHRLGICRRLEKPPGNP